MRIRKQVKKLALIGALCLFLAGCATTTVHHPNFGRDCDTFEANVDCVRVYYGTNRGVTVGDSAGLTAGGERDVRSVSNANASALALGRADIWLPKLVSDGGDRELGETPKVKGKPPAEQSAQEKYVFITRITAAGKQRFVSDLDSTMQDENSHSIMLFVHGFNVAFESALIRSAQLSVDLQVQPGFDPGVPMLFSWPSAGKMSYSNYLGDRKRSLEAAPYLTEFLDLLTSEPLQVTRVNIIAHSMGNRVLTEALEDYAANYLKAHPKQNIEFRIVLAAADVERDVFDLVAANIGDLQPNVTIYTSDNDRALEASKLINRLNPFEKTIPRLGDTDGNKPYIREDLGFVTVDATPVATELFGLGHGYYSDNPFILNDIRCAMSDTPTTARALSEQTYDDEPGGQRFFRTDPDVDALQGVCNLRRQNYLLGEGMSTSGTMTNGRGVADRRPSRTISVPPPPSPPPSPPPAPVMAEETPVAACSTWNQAFVVYFEWDAAALTAQASAVVDQAIANIYSSDYCQPVRVTIVGHTDTSGGSVYNQSLSARRAAVVANALRLRGIDADIINTQASGEDELAKATRDGVREPLNRRSEVMIIVD